MQKERINQRLTDGSGTFLLYVVAALYVILGLSFLFVPQLEALHLCYLFAICLLLIGVIRIAEYFIRESYRNSAQYGFSIGVIAMILGICVMIRVQQFVSVFHLFLGIGILITAVIKLQHALDLRALRMSGFQWVLVVAILMILAAALILVDPFSNPDTKNLVTYIIMTADGILTIITTTYLLIRIRRKDKNMAVYDDESQRAAGLVEVNEDEI